MFKAKLFNYRDSQTYYRNFGISPDKHFDKLCEKYGKDVAVEMIDRNMLKAWENERKRKELELRALESECPFR